MQRITGIIQTLPQQIKGNIKPTIASSGEEYQKGYNEGYTDGALSVENYLLYSGTAQFCYLNLFGKSEVVINMPLLNNASNMFKPIKDNNGNGNVTVKHLTINGSETPLIQSISQMFWFGNFWPADEVLEHITLNFDTSGVQWANNIFAYCSNLVTVDGKPLDFSSVKDVTVQIGVSAVKLAHIRFVPNTIKCNLSTSENKSFTEETIQSIIDGLADLTGQTTKTIAFHATVGAKLTDEQKVTITAKNWTLVY